MNTYKKKNTWRKSVLKHVKAVVSLLISKQSTLYVREICTTRTLSMSRRYNPPVLCARLVPPTQPVARIDRCGRRHRNNRFPGECCYCAFPETPHSRGGQCVCPPFPGSHLPHLLLIFSETCTPVYHPRMLILV